MPQVASEQPMVMESLTLSERFLNNLGTLWHKHYYYTHVTDGEVGHGKLGSPIKITKCHPLKHMVRPDCLLMGRI